MKTNEFETARYEYNNGNKIRFSKEANLQYTFDSAESLLDNVHQLEVFIQHHQEHQCVRLDVLDDYYEGNNVNILDGKRRKEEHLADHRATHNFAKYVSQFIQGYMVGVPLKTVYPNEAIDEQLKDLNRDNDADAHNSEMVLDLSIYGRAYELLYRNKRDETRFVQCSPLETFVIYDDTVEMEPIAAVRYVKNPFVDDLTKVYVYTDEKSVEYNMAQNGSLTLQGEQEHYFGGVPIIEYSNNRFRQGDFEDVVSLIDLYDAAQSDIANYMSDLNDAMLVIAGNLDIDVDKARNMKQANLLMLQTEVDAEGRSTPAKADYIYKKYDVGGTEAYKERLQQDIHKFTSTPEMNDSNFSGVQSGEAMKYKLFALEQKRANKERFFKRSLRERYRLISNLLSTASEGVFDTNDIVISFTPNLPKSIKEEVKYFAELGGELSQETKLSILSFVENPQEEMEKIEKERAEGIPYDFTGGEVIEQE